MFAFLTQNRADRAADVHIIEKTFAAETAANLR
jgi:hypothetical protein